MLSAMKFQVILWGMAQLLKFAAWRYPVFKARLKERNLVAQLKARDEEIGRWYAIRDGKLTSGHGLRADPDVTLPSRMANQRPISSSRALSCATRLRSLSRALKTGYRQAENLSSCAIPHRMTWNFIAESMGSPPHRLARRDPGICRYFRPFSAGAQPQIGA